MKVCPRCLALFDPYRVWTYYDPARRMFTRERRYLWSEVCRNCWWDGPPALEEDDEQ